MLDQHPALIHCSQVLHTIANELATTLALGLGLAPVRILWRAVRPRFLRWARDFALTET